MRQTKMQAVTFFPTLKIGSRGPSVIDLQRLLNEQFASDSIGGVIARLEEDGFLGPKTEEAVKIAQSRYLLFRDGVAGSQTWRSLTEKRILVEEFPILRLGDHGQSVTVVQFTLNAAQVGPVDSIFGRRTEAAVKDYQRFSKLVDDGVVGPKTWKALEGRALSQLV